MTKWFSDIKNRIKKRKTKICITREAQVFFAIVNHRTLFSKKNYRLKLVSRDQTSPQCQKPIDYFSPLSVIDRSFYFNLVLRNIDNVLHDARENAGADILGTISSYECMLYKAERTYRVSFRKLCRAMTFRGSCLS